MIFFAFPNQGAESRGVGKELGAGIKEVWAGSRRDGDYYKIGRRRFGGVTSRLAVEGLGE